MLQINYHIIWLMWVTILLSMCNILPFFHIGASVRFYFLIEIPQHIYYTGNNRKTQDSHGNFKAMVCDGYFKK